MVDKDQFRAKIVLSASKIFSRYGFKKTTMEEIAASLNKGKSSIYYYFGSKEEIFEAVIDHEAQVLKNVLSKVVKSTDDPEAILRKYVKVRMDSFEKLSNYYNAIFNRDLDHFDFIDKQREKYDLMEIAFLRYLLWRGVRSGHFNLENTGLSALAVQTALKGLELPLFWQKRNYGLDARLDAIIDILFYGIVRK
ncbi:MAG: TetR/AcrR family transcriptional regulator [Bacteroidales bacterium]|jgi:AcrR family transcriptional regulator|nr:TetR/AcrR family transcriptional regulator [Bacteroidales bacterium]